MLGPVGLVEDVVEGLRRPEFHPGAGLQPRDLERFVLEDTVHDVAFVLVANDEGEVGLAGGAVLVGLREGTPEALLLQSVHVDVKFPGSVETALLEEALRGEVDEAPDGVRGARGEILDDEVGKAELPEPEGDGAEEVVASVEVDREVERHVGNGARPVAETALLPDLGREDLAGGVPEAEDEDLPAFLERRGLVLREAMAGVLQQVEGRRGIVRDPAVDDADRRVE